jgi:hypothetical protein
LLHGVPPFNYQSIFLFKWPNIPIIEHNFVKLDFTFAIFNNILAMCGQVLQKFQTQ